MPGSGRRAPSARRTTTIRLVAALAALLSCLAPAACADGDSPSAASDGTPALRVGAIPDQDPQQLQRLHGVLARHLSEALDVPVEYVPVTDYTAAVTAFRVGDLDLVWYGGLTGVQARAQVDGALALAQRDIDRAFHSVFVASARSGLEPIDDARGLAALRGRTFTFGSESSTSGRVMPQFFLARAGVALDDFEGEPGFSGSHDRTIELVEAGSYDAGVLNEQVWRDRLADGSVDRERIREIWRTPAYHDYHWVLRPDADERFGDGFAERARRALLAIDGSSAQERRILELFGASRFVPVGPDDHREIEQVAREAGLLE